LQALDVRLTLMQNNFAKRSEDRNFIVTNCKCSAIVDNFFCFSQRKILPRDAMRIP